MSLHELILDNASSTEIRKFLGRKPDPTVLEARDSEGRTPLACCFKHPHGGKKHRIDVARALLSLGASADVMLGDSPLVCVAASLNNPTWIELMLKYKGNVNAVDSNGLTPLLIAVSLDPFLQLTQLFNALIKNGADLTAVDKTGRDVWHTAQESFNLLQLMTCMPAESVDRDWLRRALVDEILSPFRRGYIREFKSETATVIDTTLLLEQCLKRLQQSLPTEEGEEGQARDPLCVHYLCFLSSILRVTVPADLSTEWLDSAASISFDIALALPFWYQFAYRIIEIISSHAQWSHSTAERLIARIIAKPPAEIRLHHVSLMELFVPHIKSAGAVSSLVSFNLELEKLGLRVRSASRMCRSVLNSDCKPPAQSTVGFLYLPTDAIHQILLQLSTESDIRSLVCSCRHVRNAFLAAPDRIFAQLLRHFSFTNLTKRNGARVSAKTEFCKRVSMRQKRRTGLQWNQVQNEEQWGQLAAADPSTGIYTILNLRNSVAAGVTVNMANATLEKHWRIETPVDQRFAQIHSPVQHPVSRNIAYLYKSDEPTKFMVHNPHTRVALSQEGSYEFEWLTTIGTCDFNEGFIVPPGEVWAVRDGAELNLQGKLAWPKTLRTANGDVSPDELDPDFLVQAFYQTVPRSESCILTTYFEFAWLYDIREGYSPQWDHPYPKKHRQGTTVAPSFRTDNTVWFTSEGWELFEVDLRMPDTPVWSKDLLLQSPEFDRRPTDLAGNANVITLVNAPGAQAFVEVQMARCAPLFYSWDFTNIHSPALQIVKSPTSECSSYLTGLESSLMSCTRDDRLFFASFE